jgi:ABC-2 type transport system ATP-binding protein
MSNDNIAVQVTQLSKSFKLPHEKTTSVKSLIIKPFRNRNYETERVLKDVSFEIKNGEFFGIVGRNGSGKSTLLKLLAGIYSPDKGRIEVHGKLTPFIELGVGFNPELTGRENVYLNGALLGFNRKEISRMYDDIVNFAELEKFMDQKLKNYSSGMQVRLAFSIATRAESPILLLDEVLAVGDAEFQRKCIEYFKELKRKERTVILVTHDMDVVREFCDRGILLNNGEIAFSGKPDAIAREYLKIFSMVNKVAEKAKDDGTSRWGNGKVAYDDASVVLNDDVFTLKLTVKAKEQVDTPVYGFLVKSPDGNPVMGTNSHLKRLQHKTLKAGETTTVTWKFPNILPNGLHSIDIAISNTDGATVYDWWERALSFSVVGKDKTPYMTAPAIDIKISE